MGEHAGGRIKLIQSGIGKPDPDRSFAVGVDGFDICSAQ
jgi:hypothetical protein